MARRILIILLMCIPLLQSFGQVLNFKNYFVDNGLSQSQITAIDHDKKGLVWFSTYGGGVNSFDGTTFRTYDPSLGLPHHQVLDIYVDVHNNVWCALQNGGISVIHDQRVHEVGCDSCQNNVFTAIDGYADQLYAGTDNGLLFRKNEANNMVLHHNFGNHKVNSVLVHDTLLFVAVEGKGLYRVTETDTYLLFDADQLNTMYLHLDNLYLGVDNELHVYNVQTNELSFKAEFASKISGLTFDARTTTVWAALYGNGIARYINGSISYLTEANGLAGNYTLAIHRDLYGLIWIGTDGAGVSRFSGFEFIHYSFNDKLSGQPIMNIFKENEDQMWFASYGNGIIKKNKGEYTIYNKTNGFPSNTFYSIEKTGNGFMWFTTREDGLVKFSPQTGSIQHFHSGNGIVGNNLLYLKEGSDGNLYVTSKDQGIFIYDGNTWKQLSRENGLPDNHINYLCFDDDNNTLWLASATSGLVKISYSDLQQFIKGESSHVPTETIVLENEMSTPQQILTIVQDQNGIIWVGFFGGGIASVKNGALHPMKYNRQLNSLNIYSLTYDDEHNSLWAGTDLGIAKIAISAKSIAIRVNNYSGDEGFSGVECNRNAILYDSENSSLWTGTVKGVTQFFPDLYFPPGIAPKLSIQGFTYQGESLPVHTSYRFDYIEWDRVPEIPHDSNNVRIQFKGIDQWQPYSVQYQWVLMGLKGGWHELTTQQQVEYNYLPPGRYVFKLRAINGQGIWTESPLHLPFTIERPYWKTNWFYASIVLVFIGIVTIFMYMRQRSLRTRNRKLMDAVYERTEALNNEKLVVEQQREELRAQTEHLEQANKELEKLSLVASKTDNAVLIADKDAKWEWANEGFVKMYGYTLDEFIAQRGETILNASSTSKINHIIEEAVYLKKSVTYTAKASKKDSTEIWVQSTLTPIFDDHDALKRFIVIDTDITHIKQINNELRKLSLVASKTDNSVIMMNETGRIEWVNDAFHRFYDMSLEEFKYLYQKTIFDLHSDVQGLFNVEEIIKSRKSKSFVSSFVTRKGVHKWIQSLITPVAGMGNGSDHLIAIETDITRIKEVEEEVKEQRKKSDELLLNILPAETAEELKTQGQAQPRYYNSASVLFCDFKNFTAYCEELSPQQLVSELREYFDVYDDIVEKYFVEKIKTIGDAYMCAGGLPIRNRSHAFDVVLTALEIQIKTYNINLIKQQEGRQPWQLRMGIHTGDLVAGVVGKKKFAYDIWGDTVNIASRMESACDVGRINISGDTYNIVKEYFECTYRGKIEAKNIGKFDMYFVDGIKPDFSVDGMGAEPNQAFKEFLAKL
jgi:PAS domain S-box-containing protein